MTRSTNSVVLRAKARLSALRAWGKRLADVALQNLLSASQFSRANDWTIDEARKAAKLICAFSSKAALISELQTSYDPDFAAYSAAHGYKRVDLIRYIVCVYMF